MTTKNTAAKSASKLKGSKKYRSNLEKVMNLGTEAVSVEKAVETLLSLDHAKFKDGVSVELHMKLNINPTKSDQLVRTATTLPHGNGKTVKVAAFVQPENEKVAKDAGAEIVGSDDLIEQIKKDGKVNFDAAIAEPSVMKKMGVIARVLGTAGVMPSPKNQTVGTDIAEMVKTLQSGRVEIKNDKTGNVHILVGKINKSFNAEKLVDNIKNAIEAVEKAKPEVIKKKFVISTHIAATQSPGIKIS